MVGVSDVGVMAIIAVGVRAGNQNCVVVGQCVLDQSGEEETCFEHGEEGTFNFWKKKLESNCSLKKMLLNYFETKYYSVIHT